MTTLVLTVNATQSADGYDTQAMRFIIGAENLNRNSSGQGSLPVSTKQDLRASYETCLTAIIVAAHVSYIQQANDAVTASISFRQMRSLWANSTPAQQAAAMAALA